MMTNANQVSEQDGFSCGLAASAFRFHRHEHGINLGKVSGIIGFEHSSLLGRIVFIENATPGRAARESREELKRSQRV
jgi:hypothetical protein